MQALAWYRQAAEAGDARGMHNLGGLHYQGQGVPADAAKAFRWYLASAEAGDPSGMHNTAHLLKHGEGVERDLEAHYLAHRADLALRKAPR